MMTGTGPFGPVGMGGMFSVVKVRDTVARGDFKDPGPYKHPPGTLAREYTGELAEPTRTSAPQPDTDTLKVRKPAGHSGH
jgi:manganese oxidase